MKTNPTIRGFTLVEIIVSLAIFSVVATVALGAVVKIVDANRKAQTLQAAMTNLNFALESMSREMREGKRLHCEETSGTYLSSHPQILSNPPRCPDGISGAGGGVDAVIAFNSSREDPDDETIPLITAYRFYPITAEDGGPAYELQKAQQMDKDDSVIDDDFTPITDPEMVLTNFYVQVSDDRYSLAIIKLSGYAGVREKDRTYFDVQTAISVRGL